MRTCCRACCTGFDATQHLTGPVVLTDDDADVRADTHVRGYDHMRGAEGGETWGIVAPGGSGESSGRPYGHRKRVRNPGRTCISHVPWHKIGQTNPVIPWKL